MQTLGIRKLFSPVVRLNKMVKSFQCTERILFFSLKLNAKSAYRSFCRVAYHIFNLSISNLTMVVLKIKCIQRKYRNRCFGILFPKLIWPTVRKNCSEKTFEIWVWRSRNFEITFYSNSERSKQFLKQSALINLFSEGSQI